MQNFVEISRNILITNLRKCSEISQFSPRNTGKFRIHPRTRVRQIQRTRLENKTKTNLEGKIKFNKAPTGNISKLNNRINTHFPQKLLDLGLIVTERLYF
jgi:hypothetical protein